MEAEFDTDQRLRFGGPDVAYGSAVNEAAVNEAAVNESAVNELAVNESAVNGTVVCCGQADDGLWIWRHPGQRSRALGGVSRQNSHPVSGAFTTSFSRPGTRRYAKAVPG